MPDGAAPAAAPVWDDLTERRADLEAEGVVLSALLMGSPVDTLARVQAAGLQAWHFFSEANRHVYEAALAGGDVTAIRGRLADAGRLHAVGGSPYLALLLDTQPATAAPELHAATIVELARQRAWLELTARLAIRMRHGEVDFEGAKLEMRAFYMSEVIR